MRPGFPWRAAIRRANRKDQGCGGLCTGPTQGSFPWQQTLQPTASAYLQQVCSTLRECSHHPEWEYACRAGGATRYSASEMPSNSSQ